MELLVKVWGLVVVGLVNTLQKENAFIQYDIYFEIEEHIVDTKTLKEKANHRCVPRRCSRIFYWIFSAFR